MTDAAGIDYGRLAREAELALRLDALILDVIAHAELLAEHTAEVFEPVGSSYYLDQFLTVAGEDFRRRMSGHGFGHGNLALAVPRWVGRFSVLTRTRLPILEYPGERPSSWDAPFHVVGLATFGAMPSLINPHFDGAAVYPCRAPRADEW